ncbi:hypothetical protein [uncultured Aquimarina sp.]|uniref:hypothetical protein n=1 Tax=uncultured Aquimarina sp. TaxID=575652 RepID=UPI00260F6C3E|nr:hypothetical protein [uncultured Aquimarina sp.]
MKLVLKIIFFLFVVFATQDILAQRANQKIIFNYEDSGYFSGPGYSSIEIVMERTGRYCEISVFTDGRGQYYRAETEKWRRTLAATQTKEDSLKLMKNAPKDLITRNTYELTVEEFENIEKTIASIDSSKIYEHIGMAFSDGYSCEIEYGNSFNSIKYKVHSPGFKGKNRSPNFSKACRLILEAAYIKPRKIL